MSIVESVFLQQSNVPLLPDIIVNQAFCSDLLWQWKKSEVFDGASLD